MEIRYEDLIGTFEQKTELVSQFTLFDDILFSMVMQDNDTAEYVLRLCTGIPDLKLISSNIQQAVRNLVGKSSTLDFIAEDSEGKLFNIEVQNADDPRGFGPKRSRFHHSIIDASLIPKGVDYDECLAAARSALHHEQVVLFVPDGFVLVLLNGFHDSLHLLEDGILALQVCLQLLRSLRGDLRFARLILRQQFFELLLQGCLCLFRFFLNFFGLFVEAILELIHLFFNLRYVLRQEVFELLDDLLSGACHSFKTFCCAKLQQKIDMRKYFDEKEKRKL